VGASDLQASPLSEGDRRLWVIYSKRQRGAQGARTGGGGVVRLGGRGGKEAKQEGGGVGRREGIKIPPATFHRPIRLGLARKHPAACWASEVVSDLRMR